MSKRILHRICKYDVRVMLFIYLYGFL